MAKTKKPRTATVEASVETRLAELPAEIPIDDFQQMIRSKFDVLDELAQRSVAGRIAIRLPPGIQPQHVYKWNESRRRLFNISLHVVKVREAYYVYGVDEKNG